MQPAEPIYRLPPFKVEATYIALAETVDWGLSLFKVPEQWKRTRGEGVKVAILDTGIELDHPDLRDGITEKKGLGIRITARLRQRQVVARPGIRPAPDQSGEQYRVPRKRERSS